MENPSTNQLELTKVLLVVKSLSWVTYSCTQYSLWCTILKGSSEISIDVLIWIGDASYLLGLILVLMLEKKKTEEEPKIFLSQPFVIFLVSVS